MMTPTWQVWSIEPPECLEEFCTPSMLDAARGWAERQFRGGRLVSDGHEVLACMRSDADKRQSAYRLRIMMVHAPAYRAAFLGLAFEATPTDSTEEDHRG